MYYIFINTLNAKSIEPYSDRNEEDDFLKKGILVRWITDTPDYDDSDVYYGVEFSELSLSKEGGLSVR